MSVVHVPPEPVPVPTVAPPKPDKHRRNRGRSVQRDVPRFDQELRQAKNRDCLVILYLATEFEFTDNNGTVQGKVQEVDRYFIKLDLPGFLGRSVWIAKSCIGAAEVQL